MPPRPRLHLPFADWPEADRRMWHCAVQNSDPFSDAAGARLAKTTLHNCWIAWRRFLGFLTMTEPEALHIAPAERLTMARVRQFVDHLGETNTPYSVAGKIDTLYGAARILLPEKDLSWLRAVKARLYAAAPLSGRLRPVITSMQLRDLGLQLMAESKIEPTKQVRMADAIRYRDGLMITLLAFIPLRHKNFAALEIGRNLVKEEGSWSVIIAPEDTKTNTPIDFQVPEVLGPHLATYLKRVRPRLLRRPALNALWVSAKGGVLCYAAVGAVITRHTSERLGVCIALHDARDAAATTWAIAAPDRIGVARDLLAHADLRTTTKHYNRARGIEASRAYGQLIARMRSKNVRDS